MDIYFFSIFKFLCIHLSVFFFDFLFNKEWVFPAYIFLYPSSILFNIYMAQTSSSVKISNESFSIYRPELYVELCSLRHAEKLRSIFDNNWKGQFVDWEGEVIRADETLIELKSEDPFGRIFRIIASSSPAIMNHYALQLKPSQKMRIKGKIVHWQDETIVIDADITKVPQTLNPFLTIGNFTSIFGSTARQAPEKYFDLEFKNRRFFFLLRIVSYLGHYKSGESSADDAYYIYDAEFVFNPPSDSKQRPLPAPRRERSPHPEPKTESTTTHDPNNERIILISNSNNYPRIQFNNSNSQNAYIQCIVQFLKRSKYYHLLYLCKIINNRIFLTQDPMSITNSSSVTVKEIPQQQ